MRHAARSLLPALLAACAGVPPDSSADGRGIPFLLATPVATAAPASSAVEREGTQVCGVCRAARDVRILGDAPEVDSVEPSPAATWFQHVEPNHEHDWQTFGCWYEGDEWGWVTWSHSGAQQIDDATWLAAYCASDPRRRQQLRDLAGARSPLSPAQASLIADLLRGFPCAATEPPARR